ncbi:MAG TPA: universal stress protein [Cyclobacteriaceae bacterium]|nr:universal stress protein [Cyclobacteriaceae bacterium]
MKVILIALDYSPTAPRIAEIGYELATTMKAQTILLHVVADVTYYSSRKYSPIIGFDNLSDIDIIQTDTNEQLQTASYKYLDKLKKLLGDESIQTVVKNGECGEIIVRTATELNADIIVMGTHSRRGFEKLLLGSIAKNVLRNSLKPVLIIPIKIAQENKSDN